jgi:hypothetical protein
MDMDTEVGTLTGGQAAILVANMIARAVKAGAGPLRGWKRKRAQFDGPISTTSSPA